MSADAWKDAWKTEVYRTYVRDSSVIPSQPIMAEGSGMRPAQAKFLLRFLLPQLKSEQIITKKILFSVPPGKGDYRPDPKCMSALKLGWHLAVVESTIRKNRGHACGRQDLP
jgi:hypothetical protein